jgi:hypothetical protein
VHGEIPHLAEGSTLAAPLVDVITGLMIKDPARRMSLMEVRRRIRPLLPEPGTVVFPPDDSDADAGPADNKPTTHLAAKPGPQADAQDGPLAAAPGPLPWASPDALPLAPVPGPLPWGEPPLASAPGPLPFSPRPVARRRSPAMTGFLLVVAVVLFAAAAGGGFAATRKLAGQRILPVRVATSTTNVPQAPPVRSFTTVSAQAVVGASTTGSDFSISVPTGWTKFIEQRGSQSPLPASTAVRWVKSDGTAELTVERFPKYANGTSDYLDTVQKNDDGTLLTSGTGASTVYLWRSSSLNRDTYFNFASQDGSADLWVVSVTVPVEQELSGLSDLFDRIRPSFRVTG